MSLISREEVPRRVSQLLDGRPVRWAPPEQVIGDFDGRLRTLEVFNADAGEQRLLLRRLRHERQEFEQAAGGPIIIIFHTTEETRRLYSHFVVHTDSDSPKPVFLPLVAMPTRWVEAETRIGQIGPQRRAA